MVLGAVTKDVIFRIGSSGGAATAAKFAAVAAAIAIVGRKMAQAINEAQKFEQIVKRTTTEMSEFNRETKGLIDTYESYVGANKLVSAGLELNAEQMATVGKASIALAKATGKDATEAYQRLVESISKGSTRALKELGIDLENTEDLALAQAEAIEKLTALYGDYQVEIETTQERVFALENALGTIEDQLTAAAWGNFVTTLEDVTEAMTGVQGGLESISDQLMENDGVLAEYVTSWEGMKNQLLTFVADIIGAEEKLQILAEQRDKALKILSLQRELRETAARKAEAEQIKKKIALIEEETRAQRAANEENRKAKVDLAFSLSETGEKVRGRGRADLGIESDIVAQRRKESVDLQIQMMEQLVAEEERAAAQKLKQEEELEKERLRMKKQAAAEQQKAVEKHLAAETKARQNAAAAGVQALSDLGTLMNTESRKAFNVGKAAAISEATISTSLGAQKAFTALAGIPVVGPALGAAAAGAAIAAGVIRIQQIASTEFGGGGSLTGASVALPSTSAGSTAAVNAPVQEEAIDRRPIQVIMDGRMVTDAIVEDSIKRQRQGDRGLVVRT